MRLIALGKEKLFRQFNSSCNNFYLSKQTTEWKEEAFVNPLGLLRSPESFQGLALSYRPIPIHDFAILWEPFKLQVIHRDSHKSTTIGSLLIYAPIAVFLGNRLDARITNMFKDQENDLTDKVAMSTFFQLTLAEGETNQTSALQKCRVYY